MTSIPEVESVKVISGYTNRSENATWPKVGVELLGVVPSRGGASSGGPSSALTASQQAVMDKSLAASHAAAMNAMTDHVYLRR